MTTQLKILGVDPGLHGGWALLDDNANLIDARHFPHRHNLKSSDVTLEIDLHALAAQIEAIGPTHAIIEAVSSRPHIEAAERERCAKIAEGSFLFDIETWLNSTKKEMTAHVAKAIAAAIRSGK